MCWPADRYLYWPATTGTGHWSVGWRRSVRRLLCGPSLEDRCDHVQYLRDSHWPAGRDCFTESASIVLTVRQGSCLGLIRSSSGRLGKIVSRNKLWYTDRLANIVALNHHVVTVWQRSFVRNRYVLTVQERLLHGVVVYWPSRKDNCTESSCIGRQAKIVCAKSSCFDRLTNKETFSCFYLWMTFYQDVYLLFICCCCN